MTHRITSARLDGPCRYGNVGRSRRAVPRSHRTPVAMEKLSAVEQEQPPYGMSDGHRRGQDERRRWDAERLGSGSPSATWYWTASMATATRIGSAVVTTASPRSGFW